MYIFLIFLWFILLILGYLDILDFFIFTEREKIYVKITKLVSNTEIFRAYYNKNDEKLEFNKKEDHTSSYNIELKSQSLLS